MIQIYTTENNNLNKYNRINLLQTINNDAISVRDDLSDRDSFDGSQTDRSIFSRSPSDINEMFDTLSLNDILIIDNGLIEELDNEEEKK